MKNESTAEAVLVVALYEQSDGKLLMPLVFSDKWQETMLRILGGGVNQETDEFPIAAAGRETKEECGLTVEGLRLFITIEKPSHSGKYAKHYQYVFIGQVHSLAGFLPNVMDGEEQLTCQLFPVEDVRASLASNTPLRTPHGEYFILPAHGKVMRQVFQKLFD